MSGLKYLGQTQSLAAMFEVSRPGSKKYLGQARKSVWARFEVSRIGSKCKARTQSAWAMLEVWWPCLKCRGQARSVQARSVQARSVSARLEVCGPGSKCQGQARTQSVWAMLELGHA